MRGLSRRLWSIQEEERRRVARELHDQAGQAMTALKLRLDLARRETDVARVREQLEGATKLAGEVLDELRRIAHDLRTGSLEELGLVPALRALVEDFRGSTGVHVDFRAPAATPRRSDRDCEATVYRFVQEALVNVARHARAKRVRVSLEQDGERATARVEDDGAGFDPALASGRGHVGLVGMQERARMLGGDLRIESRPGGGTKLTLEVPMFPTE